MVVSPPCDGLHQSRMPTRHPDRPAINNVATDVLPLAQTLAWVFSANLLYYYGGNAVEAVRK